MQNSLTDNNQEVVTPETAMHSGSHDKDESIRNMREIIKMSRETNERLAQELNQLRQSNIPKEDEDDPWKDLDDNEALEVSQAKKIFQKQAQKLAKKAAEEAVSKIQSNPNYLEDRARGRYKDFDDVMSQENIQQIINSDPVLHRTIMKSEDPIEAAYKIISRSADYDKRKAEKNNKYMADKAKLQEIQSKPKNPNNVIVPSDATSAVGFGRLSKNQQKELWTEHNRKLGRRG
ncbi:MAG: hypothetical protein ACYC0F_18460 [Rhodanobacter sp.]